MMNASRAAVMVVGVNLIAVWAVAAAGGRPAGPGPVAPGQGPTPDQVVGRAQTLLVEATDRLKVHGRHGADRLSIVRDPFRFAGERSALETPGPPPVPARASESVTAALATQAAAPDIVLQGMAETRDGDDVQRTAIIRAGNDLVLATLGTAVGGRYRVAGLTADSVELDDVQGGPRRTVRLQ